MHNSEGAEAGAAAGDCGDTVEAAVPGVQSGVVPHSDDEDRVEITLDLGDDSVVVSKIVAAGGGGGDDSDNTRQLSPTRGQRLRMVSEELQRLNSIKHRGRSPCVNRSDSAADHVLKVLDFISKTGSGAIWPAVEKRFDELSRNGQLQRSKFGLCIGMGELEFAGELFDTLARRRNISSDSISKAELEQFFNQISDRRLETFFDMVDKNADVRITLEEVKECQPSNFFLEIVDGVEWLGIDEIVDH